MLKTNGTLLLLLPAAGHGRSSHGACSLTMDGSTETCSAPYSAPPSHLRATAQVSDIACHLLASDLGRVNLLLISKLSIIL